MSTLAPPSPLASPRRPRVNQVPPYAFSFGTEATAFARKAGLNADDWQEESVTHMLGIGPEGRWACPDYAEFVPRQNGKGGVLEIRVLFGFFLLGEKKIVWSAHLFNTALEGFNRLKALIKNLGVQVGDNENLIDVDGILVRISNTNGKEGFTRLDTGAQIQFVARSDGNLRGFTGDLLIIDEAYALTNAQQEAMFPSTSARSMAVPGCQIIFTSSPPIRSDPNIVVFRLKKQSDEGDVEDLCFRDWGVAGDLDNLGLIDVTDRELWRAANPALGVRISERHVAKELKRFSEHGFARERLGVWPPIPVGVDELIRFEDWKNLGDPKSQPGPDIAFAVDITPDRKWAAIASYSVRADGLGHMEQIEHREGTAWIAAWLAERKERWDPVAIALDAKGPAGSLLLELDDVGIKLPTKDKDGKRAKPRRGDLIIPTANDYAGACGSLIDAIEQKAFRHRDQVQLNTAVGGVAKRPLGDAYAWARKTSSANIAPLVAATLARWAFLARINALAAPAPPPATAPVPEIAGAPGGNELWRPTSRLNL
ncbi:hypothetical protein NQK81_13345 [Amycolatopsis roodepoortensis]|uniref:hypothetical protein n=1 Tax=Amycolatopsis roodepoortensis TaxID=700274 RepID=UPI00214BF42A|nr:hypothetical protein [Amycolatopsis roodepoortensis]UUV34390.1 hypothetical protein NQK81_13345 [Amycolatopsis roodepoortensis]